ncbi:MAG TPA: CHAT domain-containing tetratricopeptide repeat protein [Pyrinomonadaceae bacterium]|jgi:CHAT domain-containing protein/tetratricopeptide (TPR) repeat protein
MKPKLTPLVYVLAVALVLATLPASFIGTRAEDKNNADSSLAASATPQDKAQAGQALKQGRALLKRGKSDQALERLQFALKIFKQSNSPKGEAAANDALGDLYMRQGQYTVALNYYQGAHDAFRNAASKQGAMENTFGMPDNEYNANLMLAKIGEANYRAGRVAEASAAYGQMNVVKPDPTKLATGGGSTPKKSGGGFGGLGNLAKSIPGAGGGSGIDKAITIAGAVKGAIELYRQSIVYSAHELGLGRVDYYNKNYESSKKHFNEALSTAGMAIIGKFGQSKRVRAAARTSLGDVSLQMGDYKGATKFYADAVKGAREDKRLDLMWPAQRGLGRAQWLMASQGKDPKSSIKAREAAIASYREALATIETIRAGSVRSDDARSTFLGTTKDVYDEASSNLAELALLSAPSARAPLEGQALAYAAEGFKIAEQGRARSLLDLLGESGSDITQGVPPDLLKRKQDNLDRQQEIAQSITGVAVGDDDSKDAPKPDADKLEAELETLSLEFDQIENQIRSASPKYAALTAPQPLSLQQVQQQVLDDKTALLEYSLGDERSYLWAVTPTSVSLYKLPAKQAVDQQAQDLRAALLEGRKGQRLVVDPGEAQRGLGLGGSPAVPGNPVTFANASNALYKTVVEPAASVIGDRRLLIVPDGALNYIPFEALLTASGGTDYATMPYLIKTNEVIYAPSASVVGVIRQQGAKASGKDMLIVADPVFNTNDPRAKGAAAASATVSAETRGLGLASALTDVGGAPATAPATGLQLARLNGTRVEADQIAKLARAGGARADVWLDLEANEGKVGTTDIKSYRIVHIATHGLLNAERPQFTGLVLSLVGNKQGDGFLRTDEIFNLGLNSRLVMLSACETGLGKQKKGEGVIGLTRAFMYAGTPTVGVSLWSVADNSTAQLMTDFYKRFLATPDGSPTAAMRAAQQNMITGKKYAAPYYWAPFVLVGEWR